MNTITQCYGPDRAVHPIPADAIPVLSEDGSTQRMDESGGFIWRNPTGETLVNDQCVFAHQQPEVGATGVPTAPTQAAPANNTGSTPPQMQSTPLAANPAPAAAPPSSPDVSALLSMMATMQSQMMQLAMSRDTRSATATEEARAKLFKFGTPDRFDGSKKEKVRGFLDQCNREFQVKPGLYTDLYKIMYAESYMDGQAQAWAREYSLGRTQVTWREFEELLAEMYGGGRNIFATENEFYTLKQGNKSLSTYITEYNDLAALLPGLNEYVRRSLFRVNLNQAFKDAISPMPNQEHMMLAEFQMECRRYEDQAEARRHTSSGNHTHTSGNRYAGNHVAPRNPVVVNTTVAPPVAAATSGAMPMEVDAARMPGGKLCYNCWQPSHGSSHCSNAKRSPPAWWQARQQAGRMQVAATYMQPPAQNHQAYWDEEFAKQNGDEPLLWTPGA
jgi:hypothetical protein